MLWYISFGAFGAFGILCALWTLFGFWLLPMGRGSVLVFRCRPGALRRAEDMVRYFAWLIGMGLYAGELLLLDEGLTEEELQVLERRCGDPRITLRRREQPPEVERENIVGTGNDRDTGDSQRGGVPEL